MSEFRAAVAAATQGTPYTVVDTKKGFSVRLNVADSQWWGLYNRAGLRKTFRWDVVERGSRFSINDRQLEIRWHAGVPTAGAALEMNSGRIVSFSRQKIWALSDRGRIEPVVDYKFNSREGRDLIRLVAGQLGLKERWPLTMKITLAAVVATPATFAVIGIIELVHRLIGAH